MCFLMKLFAPLPFHIAHLSLCCFLPFWVSRAVLCWFLAGVPRSRSLSRVSAPVPRCSLTLSVSFPRGLSQRVDPPGAAQTPRAGSPSAPVVSEQPQGDGSGRRERVAQAGRPQRPRHGLGGTGHVPHGAGTWPRHGPGQFGCPQQGSGVPREPSSVPRGRGSAAHTFRPRSHGVLFSLSSRNWQRGNSWKMLCRSPSQHCERCSRNPCGLGQGFQLLTAGGRALLRAGKEQKSRGCQGRARQDCVELLRDPRPSRVPGGAEGEPKPFKSRSEVEVTINLCSRCNTGLPLPCPSRGLPRPRPADRTARPGAEAQPPERHPENDGRRGEKAAIGESSPSSSGTTLPSMLRGAAGRIAPGCCPRRAAVAAGGGGCQAVTAGGTRPGCCCCCCCRDAAGAAASQADPARPWTSKRGPASSSAITTTTTPSCCRRRRAGRVWSRARRRQRRPRRRQREEAAEEGGSQPPEPPRRSRRPELSTACRASCISCSTSGAASRRSAQSGRRSGRSCR